MCGRMHSNTREEIFVKAHFKNPELNYGKIKCIRMQKNLIVTLDKRLKKEKG
jgi:hypothetical protein